MRRPRKRRLSNPRLRRARREDVAALVSLERCFPTDRLSAASFRHLLAHGHADIWVWVERGEIAGDIVVLYRRGSRAARLYSLVTHPAWRGRGIASHLLEHVERDARARRYERLHLEVRPQNRAAIELYRARGYHVTARLARFYEDGRDALRLQKELATRRPRTVQDKPRAAAGTAGSTALRRRQSHSRKPSNRPSSVP